MDSLVASYASSDDEDEDEDEEPNLQTPRTISSLPPPKTSIFSSLPPPTSDNPSSSSSFQPKKIVQFRPPILLKPPTLEDDSDEEEEKEKQAKRSTSTSTSTSNSSLNSFFSSLPAPKNTLGSAPALGAGRRSILDADVPASNVGVNASESNYESVVLTSGSDQVNWVQSDENYGSYAYYEDNANYATYEANYDGASAIAPLATDTSRFMESFARMPGKRGRNEIPADIIEVKQDELMKNRPREDQVKATGIAFGPSYQPVSTKGKPSKLHKRKHQIGSLYFDMKQKESELAERRSKGFLTKAETQAKYGW